MMCKCSTHIKSEDSSSSTMNFGNQTQFVKFGGQTLILKGIAPALLETFMDIIVLRRKTNQAERAFMDWLHASWNLLDPIFQILGTSLLFHLAASHIRTLSLENGYLAHSVVLMSASRITL